jgi:hypothetical protein
MPILRFFFNDSLPAFSLHIIVLYSCSYLDIQTYGHTTRHPSFQTHPQSLPPSIPVKMGSTVLPYMETKPKMIFFTDFDGTITVDDSKFSVIH